MPILLTSVRGDDSHSRSGPSPGLINHARPSYQVPVRDPETPPIAGSQFVSSSAIASPRLDLRAVARHWGEDATLSTWPRELSGRAISGSTGDKTLTIILSTTIPVGVLLIVGLVLVYVRHRRRQLFRSCFARGITPIDDEEIATWRVSRDEKTALAASMARPRQDEGRGFDEKQQVAGERESENWNGISHSHGRQSSTSSLKKPPSLIVYTNMTPSQQSPYHQHQPQSASSTAFRRPSVDGSPLSPRGGPLGPLSRKTSIDQEVLQTPVQARAPNARAGLTDEAIPGDDPFLPSPRRQPSRLYKVPPSHHHHTSSVLSSPRSSSSVHHSYHHYLHNHPYHAHRRTRSSKSSTQSFSLGLRGSNSCGMLAGGGGGSDGPPADWAMYSASELYLRPQLSHDQAALGGGNQLQQEEQQQQQQQQHRYHHYHHRHHHYEQQQQEQQQQQPKPRSPPAVYSPVHPQSPSHTRLLSDASIPPLTSFGDPFSPHDFLPRQSLDEGERMLIGQAIG